MGGQESKLSDRIRSAEKHLANLKQRAGAEKQSNGFLEEALRLFETTLQDLNANLESQPAGEGEGEATSGSELKDGGGQKHRLDEMLVSNGVLHTLLDTMPVGMVICGANAEILLSNSVAGEILGDSVTGNVYAPKRSYTTHYPDGKPFPPTEMPLWRALKRQEKSQNVEILIRRTDGSERLILTAATPTFDARGELSGAIVVFQDISLLKKTELERDQLLEEAEQERQKMKSLADSLTNERAILRAMMENTSMQIAYLDPQFNFVRVNSAYATGSGYKEEQLLGRNHFELFPNPENRSIFEQVLRTGRPFAALAKPYKHPTRPDGITYWDWTLTPVFNDGGEATGLVLSLMDVTSLEVVSQEREKRLSSLNELIAVSQKILAETEVEGLLEEVVLAARQLTGAKIAVVGHNYEGDVYKLGALSSSDEVSNCTVDVEESAPPYKDENLLDQILSAGALWLNEEQTYSHPKWRGLPEGHPPLRGLLGVCLSEANGLSNGLIMASDKAQGEFNEEDLAMLSQLASLASLGLNQIRSRSEAEQRSQELDIQNRKLILVNRLGDELTATLEIADIAGKTLLGIGELIDAEGCSIWLWDEEQSGVLVCQDAFGLGAVTLLRHLRVQAGESIIGWVAQNGESALTPDTSQDPRFSVFESAPPDLQVNSILAVPLRTLERVSGVIEVINKTKGAFRDSDRALLEILAASISIALENARLREWGKREAVLAERSRLANELHDAVSQNLFTANVLAESLPRLLDKKPERVRRGLDQLQQLTRSALAEMRSLLLELRPTAIVDSYLDDLIRHLGNAMASRMDIEVNLEINDHFSLPPEVQIAFYRIAQEALNNVYKHAQASRTSIGLDNQPAQVILKICDDGRGFEQGEISSEHLGLGIMHERAAKAGVQLEISSQIGQGTYVQAGWHRPQEEA
jgi:PAS domain S-box-containing protein